jgi:uncharacterized membrane protein
MPGETTAQSIQTLAEQLNDYLETRIEIVKLKTVDRSADALSTLASSIILILGVFLFIFLLCIGLSFYLGELLGEIHYGFFIVGGFFTIAMFILYFCRRRWLKTPFFTLIIKSIFNQ